VVTLDYANKVAGSMIENTNIAYKVSNVNPDEGPDVIKAAASEFSQTEYDAIEIDDASYASLSDGEGWVDIGTGSSTGSGISEDSCGARDPDLALGQSGYPFVTWNDCSAIYIKQWDGSTWIEVGPGSASGDGIGAGGSPSLAVDQNGDPIVAWGANHEIYVKKWNGVEWVELDGSASGGGVSNSSGSSQLPSIAVDSQGYPVVAWKDATDGDWEIYIKRWDGTNWAEIGTGSASSGGISDNSDISEGASLALDGNDYPVVAWHDGPWGDRNIYIKRWDGSSWVEIGTESATGGGISNTDGEV